MVGYLTTFPRERLTQTRDTFTATSGQTSFATSGYTAGGQMLDVYLNGIKLVEGSANDFTATNGSDVVLASGASTGDILEVVSFSTFETNGGVFTGDFSVDSPTFKVDSSNNRIGLGTASPTAQLHIVGDDTSNQVIIENTDTSNSSAPDLMLLRKSTSSAADNDVIGRIDFAGLNDANEQINYFTISARIDDNTDGTENGMLRLQHIKDGSYVEPVVIDGSGQVSVGHDAPTAVLDVRRGDADGKIAEFHTSTGFGIELGSSQTLAYIQAGSSQSLKFETNGSNERMRISSGGDLFLGTGGSAVSSSVEGISTLHVDDDFWILNIGNSRTTSQHVVRFYNGNGLVGSISTNSSATSFNTSSDYRLKENVTTSWDATSRLKQLKPSRFNFKADKDTTVDGFLAHEVSNVVPEAIIGEKDAVDEDGKPIMQGIDQSKLVPLLVKTIQELEARITALEDK